MARVDQQQAKLISRLIGLDTLPPGVGLVDIYRLGGCFHAAWCTGSEMRRGVTQNPYSENEYVAVKGTLKNLGWDDLLDP